MESVTDSNRLVVPNAVLSTIPFNPHLLDRATFATEI